MKIEMGESLVRSWLRHCKGCQFAELNWKPSSTWPGIITDNHNRWFDEAKDKFGASIMKGTSKLSQFIRQAEIDVFGLRIVDGKVATVISIDTAFHSNGLQYKGKIETAARIKKKLFRSAMILDIYFPKVPAEILFMSPRVSNSYAQELFHVVPELDGFSAGKFQYKYGCIINKDFEELVFNRVLAVSNIVEDTSELFLRSVQMCNLFSRRIIPTYTGNANLEPDTKDVGRNKDNATINISGTLPIFLNPDDSKEFKTKAMRRGLVYITEHYLDGSTIDRHWTITNLNEQSNIKGNLRSRPRYRSRNWRNFNITKLMVTIPD